MAYPTLTVAKRDIIGTGKLNALRAQKVVPGIVYGSAIEANINLQIDASELRLLLKATNSVNFVVELTLEDKNILALVKHVQINHLTDKVTHVDFMAVTPDSIVNTRVAVKLLGTAVGISLGGVVHQIVNEMPIKCAVKDIPASIDADITAVGYKECLRLSQITLPENVTTRYNGTVVLASIIKP